MDNGADMEIVDDCGRNALMESCVNDDSSIVFALLSRQAKLNQQDTLGRSALIEACAEGNLTVVHQLLSTLGVILAPPLSDDNDPEDCACQALAKCTLDTEDNTETEVDVTITEISFLSRSSSSSAPPTPRTPPLTPLLEEKIPPATIIPIYPPDQKLDLNLHDWGGRTALICACEEGHTDIALALISAGASLNLKCRTSDDTFDRSYGRTALIEACERGLPKVVEGLISAGAELDTRDGRGRTALISACVWGHDDIAKGTIVHTI
jgi:ankyrin repeat protein